MNDGGVGEIFNWYGVDVIGVVIICDIVVLIAVNLLDWERACRVCV